MGPWGGSCIALEWWWLIPLVMIAFCLLMMFVMRRGMPGVMRGMMRPPCLEAKRERRSSMPVDPATEILAKRYALGEIGKEEYEEKRSVLSGG